MKQKTLLVLGAGSLQIPAILTGKRLGLRVVALDGDPGAPGLSFADTGHVVDITNAQNCLALARKEQVDGVIHICSEVSMTALGLINREMGLHGPDPDMVICATNKERMRRSFEEGGAPGPMSIAAVSDAEAMAAVAAIGGPTIVKPSRNSGSRGVTFLPEGAQPDVVLSAFRYALAESRDRSTVIERYIEGPEYSVEALVWNDRIEIVAITDKMTSGIPHFVETGHSQPAQIGEAESFAIRQAAAHGIRALGLNWCASHAELKLAPDGPYLIEISARLGGDFITTELVPRSTGIDMVAAAIRLCLGEEPDLDAQHSPQGVAIRYLTPSPGLVVSVDGVDEARYLDGVKIVEVYVAPGQEIGKLNSSLARAGHVVAEGRTAREAVKNAERAGECIHIGTFSTEIEKKK